MTDTKLLVQRIEESGLKREYIANRIGISRHALYQKINNKTEFTTTEVQAICDVLGIRALKEKELIFFAK